MPQSGGGGRMGGSTPSTRPATRFFPARAREYNAALRGGWISVLDRLGAVVTAFGRVQETVGAAGWPGLQRADGLSQRSLLGLLDLRPVAPSGPPLDGGSDGMRAAAVPGASSSTPYRGGSCQAEGPRRHCA
jgi:hypothetical protein